jgi:tetratricopeptide (TPR) repeat protein
LNVPAGFLLADAGDEIVYRKMNSMANIKQAYSAGDVWGCRSLCLSGCPDPDDEVCLLLADCDAGIASEEFWKGRLRSACRFFDEALEYAEKTIYHTEHIEAQARLYFRYMRRISATLYSDVLDEERELTLRFESPFSEYITALEALEDGDFSLASAYAEREEEGFFGMHLRIKLLMEQGDFAAAKELLLEMLRAEEPLHKVSLYAVLCELEICCRETDDFKGAYTFANDKLQLLEELLKEV